eukprot:66980-Pleurochrysis_carterae.AAC.2
MRRRRAARTSRSLSGGAWLERLAAARRFGGCLRPPAGSGSHALAELVAVLDALLSVLKE